jgi:hypothetical protein
MRHSAVQKAGVLSAKKSHCIIAAANQPRGHRTAAKHAHSAAVALINAPREIILPAKPLYTPNFLENISSGKKGKMLGGCGCMYIFAF